VALSDDYETPPSLDFIDGYNDFVWKQRKNPPSDPERLAEYLEGWNLAYMNSYLNEIPSKQYP
jgi:hypothetical protein